MIDLSLLREHPDHVRALCLKKDPSFPIDQLIQYDRDRRLISAELDTLRAKKNELAKQARGGITPEIIAASKATSDLITTQETLFASVDTSFMDLYLRCANLLDESVPVGNKESNKVIKTVGTLPAFSFTPKNHVELGKLNDWFDFEAGVAMTGAGFPFYKTNAARVMYALTMYMLENNARYGYMPMIPPYLVNEKALTCASNFPRFKDQVYAVSEDNLYLTPTAEVNLTNLYRDAILSNEELPIRMTAWTSCFRREAGGYGATERGLIRIHQFEKCELYAIVRPEESMNELDRMVACAESILQGLGLHYQISLLAAQDASFASAKTFDIEVWLPGQNEYKEVSSCSNCTDFQARRAQIRYRKAAGDKPELVHTLNASSLAIPRLMVALMETYQQPDGSIELPAVLKKYMFW
jgi:seryl-tRNA synthetase